MLVVPKLFNAFRVLSVNRESSDREIRDSYYRQAKELHPDRPGGDAAKFVEVAQAYATIKSPLLRQKLVDALRSVWSACADCNATGVKRKQKGFTAAKIDTCKTCEGCGYIQAAPTTRKGRKS